jgi:hypothetical protein
MLSPPSQGLVVLWQGLPKVTLEEAQGKQSEMEHLMHANIKQIHCKLAQLYGQVRKLKVPNIIDHRNIKQVESEAYKIGGITDSQLDTFIRYLHIVPVASRPVLFGLYTPELKDEVAHAIDRVKLFSRDEYKSGYKDQVPMELRKMSEEIDTRYDVPFDCRPYLDDHSGPSGIEVFAHDYENPDFYTFTTTYYSKFQGIVFNPFTCRDGCKHSHRKVGEIATRPGTTIFKNVEDFNI